MKIIIAGDLVPTEGNYSHFEQGDVRKLLGIELEAIWESADIRIANLEAPITDGNNPIQKAGPNLRIPTRCVKGLKSLDLTAWRSVIWPIIILWIMDLWAYQTQ